MIADLEELTGHSTRLRPLAALFVLVGILQGLAFLLLIPFLDQFFAGDFAKARPWLLVLAGLAVASVGLNWLTLIWSYRVAVFNIGDRVFHAITSHVAGNPLGWFTANTAGKVAKAVTTDSAALTRLPSAVLPEIVVNIVSPLTIVLGLLWFDWRLSISLLVSLPLTAVCGRWMYRTLGRATERASQVATNLAARILEFVHIQPVLRAAQAATVSQNRRRKSTEAVWDPLQQAFEADREAAGDALRAKSRPTLVYQTIVFTAFAVTIAFATQLMLSAHLTAAVFVATVLMATRFAEPLATIMIYVAELRVMRSAVDSLAEIVRVEPLPEVEPLAAQLPASAEIVFDNVSFGYTPDEPVLQDLSLRVPPGSVTALVGASGSGKTTLVRLTARYFDVTAGAVRIGGADVRNIPTVELMSQIALVFQQVYLFDGTISENVRLGRPDATAAEVDAAARSAGLDSLIAKLPEGWDTLVGESGQSLSGGERQRIAIARAFLKNAPILLLDEATASLDSANETAITHALTELGRGRTVLVIAHRMSTIANADRIVVLDQGRIVEDGTHADLLARGGVYTQFWRRQEIDQRWTLTADPIDTAMLPAIRADEVVKRPARRRRPQG